MNTGLFLLRKITPPAPLLAQLDEVSHAFQFDDGTVWVDDDVVKDVAINQAITGWKDAAGNWVPGCTSGWGIFDDEYHQLAFYRDLKKALEAMSRAKPKIVTEFELEQEDAAISDAAIVSEGIKPDGAMETTVELSRKR